MVRPAMKNSKHWIAVLFQRRDHQQCVSTTQPQGRKTLNVDSEFLTQYTLNHAELTTDGQTHDMLSLCGSYESLLTRYGVILQGHPSPNGMLTEENDYNIRVPYA